jgi:hypothetical protein
VRRPQAGEELAAADAVAEATGMARRDAAELVAAEYESTEEPTSAVTVIDGPNLAEMSEIIIDVIGLGDDSVGGYRVHVFSDADHEGYGVHSVEATPLCISGVSDGVCL